MKKALFARLAVIALATGAGIANAASSAPDFTALTGQIDLSTTIAAVMAIGVGVMGLLISIKGVRVIWRMFKGA